MTVKVFLRRTDRPPHATPALVIPIDCRHPALIRRRESGVAIAEARGKTILGDRSWHGVRQAALPGFTIPTQLEDVDPADVVAPLRPPVGYERRARMRLVTILVLILASLGLPSTARAAEPAGEITVAGYASYYQDNFTKAVIAPFVQKYPNVHVTYFPQRTSAERLGTLRSQKDSPQIDVAIMDVIVARPGIAEGLFAALPPDKVPSLAQIDPHAKVAGAFGPALTFDSLALVYNTEAFPEAPTSWRALWDPRAARKVLINAPPNIQGIALTIILTKMEGGDYQKSIDPGMALLKTLAPAVQSWQATPDVYTLVTNGTAAIGIGWNAFSQLYKSQSAGKMGVVIPREGTVPQMDTINLVAGSKNSDSALLFIDYALSAEAQAALVKILHFAPVNPHAIVSPEDAAMTAATPEQRAAVIDVDWAVISDQRDRWLERWRREIIAGSR